MKLKPITAAILTAVLSVGAYAASEPATQQRQSQAGQDRSMPQSQGMERSQAQAQSSDTVRKAQEALKDKGFDAGPVDGIMGPKTEQAVKKFQESQAKLKATGKLDQQTLSALGVEGKASPAMGSTPGSQRAPAAGSPSGGGPGAKQKQDQQQSR